MCWCVCVWNVSPFAGRGAVWQSCENILKFIGSDSARCCCWLPFDFCGSLPQLCHMPLPHPYANRILINLRCVNFHLQLVHWELKRSKPRVTHTVRQPGEAPRKGGTGGGSGNESALPSAQKQCATREKILIKFKLTLSVLGLC